MQHLLKPEQTVLIPDQIPEPKDGFRLQRFEVFNWGTFHGRVWDMEPNGSTALLTGGNGSGKSTLVDGLLTLLVPHLKRKYNQASGSEKRRERDEKTYVRGAYGRIRDRENNAGITQFLRGKESYSVLLALFENARLHQQITLAQVFWLHEDGVRKFHLVATQPLSIAQHFASSGDIGELRKRLKATGAEVFDEFSRYSACFCKVFGLRSEKALDLFNEAASIKEIGSLNEFVRAHMLERTDAQGKVAELRANYENLTRAHEAIQRAEAQRAKLLPLLEQADHYQQVQTRITEAESCAAYAPFFFRRRELALLEQAIRDATHLLLQERAQHALLEEHLAGLRQREKVLYAAITNDSVGQRIQGIERDLVQAQAQLASRRKEADRYLQLMQALGLGRVNDEAAFLSTRAIAELQLAEGEAQARQLGSERDRFLPEVARLSERCQQYQQELESLRQRKSQIPFQDVQIRARLVEALQLSETDLPFIGELLRVKEDARRWEAAIERLLHNFGRQLLVPEPLYRRVSSYVDATNLRGRLVYHRVTERRVTASSDHLETNALFFKLEIKPDTPFYGWLRGTLIEHYDYLCCETVEQFQREHYALTIQGQIKQGGSRHEKDDRRGLNDRTWYVLGWDNHDKIQALTEEQQQAEQIREATAAAIRHIERQQQQQGQRRRQLEDVLTFDSFREIDWSAEERRLYELEAQKQLLEASADHLQQLRQELDTTEARIQELERTRQSTQASVTTLENQLQDFTDRQARCTKHLDAVPPAAQASLARIEADQRGQTLTLSTLPELEAQARDSYQRSANALRGQLNPLRDALVKQMTDFKRDYPAETEEMDASVEAIGEFERMLERIEHEDLPRHARRFKELLDEKVITAIALFKSGLEQQVEEIKASIDTLNASLRLIDYTPSTYIQLCYTLGRDREVQEFRQALRMCLPDVGQPRTAEANEASFQRIQALIQRFAEDERWMGKVADVRNWLEFSAEEKYKADGETKQYYTDSEGKSGGQKTKLAYTILASAVAYQYGLEQDERRAKSFRLVIIDEAFSRSDDDNTRYAMELFRHLHLQLLVVTPLNKTYIIEPYIGACHYVVNTEEENNSRVYTLTVEEYYEHKAAFLSGGREEPC